MYRLKYINQEIFATTFGLFFSIPSSEEIFLKYISPVILKDSTNPAIPLGIFIIWVLVFISSWIGLFNIIRKYHKMRGIITDKHMRNMVIAVILGVLSGLIVKSLVF